MINTTTMRAKSINSGMSTTGHDHEIMSSSFRTMNTICITPRIPRPPDELFMPSLLSINFVL